MANYRIFGKKVIADVAELSADELKAVKNYLELGYDLQERKKKKKSNDLFKADVIKSWLKENGTEEQLKTYDEKFNTPVRDKKTNEIKMKKDGTPRVRGHIATLAWFKKEFPDYPDSSNES